MKILKQWRHFGIEKFSRQVGRGHLNRARRPGAIGQPESAT